METCRCEHPDLARANCGGSSGHRGSRGSTVATPGCHRRLTESIAQSHVALQCPLVVEADGKTLYRLRASGGDPAELCRSLKAAGAPCTVIE